MSQLDVRAIDAAELPERDFPEVRQGFRVHVAEEVMDRVSRRGGEHSDREVGGVLVGELLRDEAGPYLRIETTIDALHAEEKGTELTFTHATWEHIHQVMDREHPGRRIVGWYHTHPGFGVFLSDRDLFIHQSFFNLPHQVALVYDPQRREHGIFTWREGEPTRCQRYWVGSQECLWEPPRSGADPARGKRDLPDSRDAPNMPNKGVPMRQQATADDEPLRLDWTILALVAVVALAAGIVAGGWWASRGTQQILDEAQRRIDGARLAASEETIRLLDGELLGYLRRLVDDDAGFRDAQAAMSSLERGLGVLEEGGRAEALPYLRDARERLERLGQSQGRAYQAARTLEILSRPGLAEERRSAADLARQRAGLIALYVELADRAEAAGDAEHARRLLATAVTVAPDDAVLGERLRRLREATAEPADTPAAATAPGAMPGTAATGAGHEPPAGGR